MTESQSTIFTALGASAVWVGLVLHYFFVLLPTQRLHKKIERHVNLLNEQAQETEQSDESDHYPTPPIRITRTIN